MFAFLILLLLAWPVNGDAQMVSVQPDATVGTNAGVTCSVAPISTTTPALAVNTRRRSFCACALSTNTGITYSGFTNGVSIAGADVGLPLAPGQCLCDDKYVGALWCIGAASQTLSIGEVRR